MKKNLKTDVTFGKMNVALVFFVVDVRKKERWGKDEENLEKKKIVKIIKIN